MAAERDKDEQDKSAAGQTIGGQQSHRSEYGDQTSQTDGSAGQPIGGNDSATGSGTTLTQAAEFGEARGTESKEALPGGGPETLTSERTSGAGDERTGQSGGFGKGNIGPAGSEGEGFIAAQGPGTDEYLQKQGESASSAKATGGADFAEQGRGALEEDEEEPGEGPRDVGSGGSGSSV